MRSTEPRRLRRRRARDAGWALASVLWAVTMLSLMAAATQELMLTTHRTEQHAWQAARAGAVLDAAISQAILGITAPTVADRWRVDGASREITFAGATVKVTVQAESGRYDLNAVDASVLMALLHSQGVEPDRATALANSILDWRSPAGPHRLNAATDEDYAAAGLTYRPRHAAFQSVAELKLVLGMTPELFARIRPALTVYTKRGTIDPALAPKQALLALYNGNEDQVNSLITGRNGGQNSTASVYASSQNGVISPGISLLGKPFEITADTVIDGRTYSRAIVVALTGDQRIPFVRLAWQDR